MKEVPLQEWAKRLLEDQIERLAELRNANPRDQSFKLWRQTTLTVIQRLWPGNLPKSEQFRRIAFTTPSARATRNQVRQHFERGYGEAVGYLRTLMMEIDAGALTLPIDTAAFEAATQALSPPVVPDAPQEKVRDIRGLGEGLVGSGPLSRGNPDTVPTGPPLQFTSPAFDRDPEFRTNVPGRAAAQPAEPAPEPEAAPVPATPEVKAIPQPRPAPLVIKAQEPIPPQRPVAPPPPPPAARPVAPPSAPPPMASPPASHQAAGMPQGEHDARGARRPDKRQLKEMLGFVDAPAPPPVRSPAPPAPPPDPPAPTTTPGRAWFDPPFPPAAESFDEPEADPFEHEETDADDPPDTTAPVETADLLSSSPVFARTARPSGMAQRPASLASGPGVSAVLNALAADVTRLGVPEGQRAATRAALIGLGRQFDLGTANWSSVRQTIVMVLEYPALARLLIPALVPYLNLE